MGDTTPGTAAAAAAAAQSAASESAKAAASNAVDAGASGDSGKDAEDADGKSSYTPPASQEDLDRIIEARLARERSKFSGYDELKAKASKYDELEDAKKTDEQRSAERIARLESELAAQKLDGARTRIAAEHHLDPDLLAGSSEDELTAHATKLAEAIAEAAKAVAPTNTAPRIPGEGRGVGSTPSGDWIRDALSAR